MANIAGKQLLSFIERIEHVREEKAQLADDEKSIFAEAKAAGFSPKRMRDVLKRRAMKPADLEEAQAELDLYMSAIGMTTDAPLFRAVGMMAVDLAAREQVIDAFLQLVPMRAEVIVKIGAQPVRLWRDEEGDAHVEDYSEAEAEEAIPDKRTLQ
jgi:uncharacterized protein (UPF0335 family)